MGRGTIWVFNEALKRVDFMTHGGKNNNSNNYNKCGLIGARVEEVSYREATRVEDGQDILVLESEREREGRVNCLCSIWLRGMPQVARQRTCHRPKAAPLIIVFFLPQFYPLLSKQTRQGMHELWVSWKHSRVFIGYIYLLFHFSTIFLTSIRQSMHELWVSEKHSYIYRVFNIYYYYIINNYLKLFLQRK